MRIVLPCILTACQASMPSCLASWPVVLPCTWFFPEPQVYDHPIGRGKTLHQLTVLPGKIV